MGSFETSQDVRVSDSLYSGLVILVRVASCLFLACMGPLSNAQNSLLP